MKIGLITHHWVPNFGANLQCLGTTNYLKELGHQVIVIDYRPKDLVEINKKNVTPEQLEAHEKFVTSYFELTDTYGSGEELSQGIGKYNFDLVLSGSDALFRLDESKSREDLNFPNPFWLDWTFNSDLSLKKRGFVSVSNMGSDFDGLKENTKKGISSLLVKFDKVLVRDLWTNRALKKLDSRINAVETIDPVFLLDGLAPSLNAQPVEKPYILLSPYKNLLKKKWIEKFVRKANAKGISVYSFPHPEGQVVDGSIVNGVVEQPLDPLEWYSTIVNSVGYIGVRFHPIVVCLSNSIPFISIDTYQKSLTKPLMSKTFDICRKLGMQQFCFGKIGRRLLSPGKALQLLVNQKQSDLASTYQNELSNEVAKLKTMISDYTA